MSGAPDLRPGLAGAYNPAFESHRDRLGPNVCALDCPLEPLQPLLDQWPQPYDQYRGLVPGSALRQLAGLRARRLLSGSAALVLRDGGSIAGVACWTRLAWDSEMFGMPAARLELLVTEGGYRDSRGYKALLIDSVLVDCRAQGIRHLVARVDAGDLAAIHALESAGFETIDGIQTYSLRLSAAAPVQPSNGFEIRMFCEPDLEQVLEIARSSYIYDRFHADSALSEEAADTVNETWVRNCCSGRAADAVVVAAEHGNIVAYVTCKIDAEAAAVLPVSFGSIGMVATAAAVRRRGAAKEATLGALEWFRGRGVGVVEVGTQLRNIPAGRLYEQCGFRLTAVSLTLRKVL